MLLAVAALLVSAAFAGTHSASAQGAGDAHVRVIHTSFDGPPVDVYMNSNKVASNLSFKSVSPFAAVPAGPYTAKLTGVGKSDAVLQSSVTLEAGKYYTLIAAGKFADMITKLVQDDFSPLDAGKARLRLVHTSPDTPAVDVGLEGGGPILVPNLGFADVSDYLIVDAKTINVEVRPAGSTSNAALTLRGFTLEPGRVYTVYVVGLLSGNPPLSAVPVVDSAMKAGSNVSEVLPESGPPPAIQQSAAPAPIAAPVTGAGGDSFPMGLLALALIALVSVVGGLAMRLSATRR